MDDFLTVILPTRNRSALLEGALSSLSRQTYPSENFEVIVVDNGSSDDTSHICSLFEGRIKNFRVFFDESPGLHVGRHLGLKNAKGEILVYTDDDILAVPGWLEAISRSFQDRGVALVGGRIMPEFELKPPEWVDRLWTENEFGRSLGYFSLVDLGDELREIPAEYVYGCNFAIRKSALIKAGGFHPDAMPPDLVKYRGDGESAVSTAVTAMGLKTVYNPDAVVYHRISGNRLSLDYIKQRAFDQGVSDSYTDIRERSDNAVTCSKGAGSHRQEPANTERSPLTGAKFLSGRMILILKNTLSFFLERDSIVRQTRSSYRSGYFFHQMEVARDPDLLSWIARENYFV